MPAQPVPGYGEPDPATQRPSRLLKIGPFVIGALVLLGDQLAKEAVLRTLAEEQQGASWAGGAVSVLHVNNNGAAFGIFAGQTLLYVLIACVVAAVIVAYYRFLPRERLWLRLSMGLQLGGAVSNLLDRLRHGYVVDYVEVGTLPVFNLADTAIICGVLILAYYLLVHREPPRSGDRSPPPDASTSPSAREPKDSGEQVNDDR